MNIEVKPEYSGSPIKYLLVNDCAPDKMIALIRISVKPEDQKEVAKLLRRAAKDMEGQS